MDEVRNGGGGSEGGWREGVRGEEEREVGLSK